MGGATDGNEKFPEEAFHRAEPMNLITQLNMLLKTITQTRFLHNHFSRKNKNQFNKNKPITDIFLFTSFLFFVTLMYIFLETISLLLFIILNLSSI